MTVIFCDRKPQRGRGGKIHANIGSPNDNAITRVFTEIYEIRTDNPQDDGPIITGSPLVPTVTLTTHPNAPNAICIDFDVIQDGANPYQWYGTAVFSTIAPRQPQDNPLARPDIVRWTKRPISEVVLFAQFGGMQDADGNPVAPGEDLIIADVGDTVAVTNNVNDPFDPPIMDETYDLVATVVRNVPYVPEWILDYSSHPASTNDAPVMFGGINWPEATLLMTPPEISELKIENFVQYYEMTLEISCRFRGWDWVIPNMGFNWLGPNNQKWSIMVGAMRATVPQMIDNNGLPIAGGKASDCIYIVFQRPRADWSVIRLPPR